MQTHSPSWKPLEPPGSHLRLKQHPLNQLLGQIAGELEKPVGGAAFSSSLPRRLNFGLTSPEILFSQDVGGKHQTQKC